MGTRLTKFHTYEFAYDQEYRDNFADVLARTSRVVGVSGGVDDFGRGVALSEVGNIQAGFFLISDDDPAGMTALRDDLKKLLSWGVKKLWMQPSDPNAQPRWTWARVNNINIPERRDRHTDLWQKVTLSFQCADPRWYSHPTAWLLDRGEVLDDGLTVGGYRASSTSVNDGSTLTLTNNGTTFTPLYLRFDAGANSVTDLRVSLRDAEDVEIGRWVFADTLTGGQILEVDTTALSVTVTDTITAGRYNAFTPLKGNGFLELSSGTNTLIINGTFTGNISLYADYLDAWR
ncbi:MAG: phage tail family protein [Anaerolineae bacterium]|nr:phage tail family protein [Anaerolineae bacterium]